MHLSHFVDTASCDSNKPPSSLESRTATLRTRVLDHHLLQILFHAGTGRPLFAIPAVMMLELVDDAAIFDRLADVLLTVFGAGGQVNLELFAFRAIQQDVDMLLVQLFVGDVQAETIVL